MVIAHPTHTGAPGTPDAAGAAGSLQPFLTGLEDARDRRAASVEPAIDARRSGLPLAAAPGTPRRRRYWSIRDLSRRLWLGRGYDLLRDLIHAGIVPATRSARSWWVDDATIAGLLRAFDPAAGKVRAFRGLDAWLRERSYVVPLTPETLTAARAARSGLAWRGHVYLPMSAWTPAGSNGAVTYHHGSGATIDAEHAPDHAPAGTPDYPPALAA